MLVGPRFDRVPAHGKHGKGHGAGAGHDAGGDPHASHDEPGDESGFRSVPTEEEQRETSPHRGHADDLANANGADGVIPDELNDGRGQPGHVTPGGPRPVYRSWWIPVALVAVAWAASMAIFASVIFQGAEYHVTVYDWIVSGDFRIQI